MKESIIDFDHAIEIIKEHHEKKALYEEALRIINGSLKKKNDLNDPSKILETVCIYFRITTEQISSNCRKKELVKARQIYCKLAYNPEINTLDVVGGLISRDHATVFHSIKECEKYLGMESEKQYRFDFEAIRMQIDFMGKI